MDQDNQMDAPECSDRTKQRTESESWRNELNLLGALATVQKQISTYVLRALNADALRDEPTAPSDENALGVHLINLGTELRTRAASRTAHHRGRIPGEHPPRDSKRDRPRDTANPWANHVSEIYAP